MNRGAGLGRKCARLLALRACAPFRTLIPPLVPVSRSLGERFLRHVPQARAADEAESVMMFARWYAPQQERCLRAVEAVCGKPPWIVRSSGDEDGPDRPNAGIYRSQTCKGRDEFATALGTVLLSGLRPLTAAYLAEHGLAPAPIPAFVQALIGHDRAPAAGEDEAAAPYLAPELTAELRGHLRRLHAAVPECVLACEWVLDRPRPVSVTTVSYRDNGAVVGHAACAFGLFSAQRGDPHGTARLRWLASLEAPLCSGGRLQTVSTGRWQLVQVRPANAPAGVRVTPRLTAEEDAALRSAGFQVVDDVEVLVPAASLRPRRVLVSSSLADAWSQVLALDPRTRRDLAVMVEQGTVEEHAGLNFLTMRVPVVVLARDRVPPLAASVVVDPVRARCYFSTDPPFERPVRTEPAAWQPLPARAFAPTPLAELRQWPAGEVRRLVADLLDSPPGDEAAGRRIPGESLSRLREALSAGDVCAAARERIVAATLLPQPDTRVFDAGAGWVSPSILGMALAYRDDLDREFWTGVAARIPPSHPARAYVLARLSSRGVVARPRALGVGALETLLAGEATLRSLSDTMLGALLDVAEAAARERPGLDDRILRLAVDFESTLADLGLHGTAERSALWSRLVRALRSISGDHADAALLDDAGLAPELRIRWMEWAVGAPERAARVFDSCRRLRQALDRLAWTELGVPSDVTAGFTALTAVLGATSCPVPLDRAVYGEAVDAFDRSGKRRLMAVAADLSPSRVEAYRALLAGWIDFLVAATGDGPVLQGLQRWLRDDPRARDGSELALVGRPWWEWISPAAATGPALPNLHQLHNVLHQLSLRQVCLGKEGEPLPATLGALVDFLNTFTKVPNRLLRYGPRLAEIERQMDIHKAGFTLTPAGLVTEFAEPPSTGAGRLARLDTLEILLDKFTRWFPEIHYRHHRVKQGGVWTLCIEARSTGQGGAHPVHDAVFALVTLFDGAMDLSDSVPPPGLPGRFGDAAWPDIFRALIAYRRDLDESVQYMDLFCHPLARLLVTLLLHPELEPWAVEAARRPFGELLGEILDLAAAGATRSLPEWEAWKSRLDLLSLLLGVYHAGEALEALSRRAWFDLRLAPLGRAVLSRRSLAPEARRLGQAPPRRPLSALQKALLHIRPDLLLDGDGWPAWLGVIGGAPRRCPRAVAFLLHRHADRLAPGDLARLVAGAAWVPYGATAAAEAALRGCAAGRRRYDIRYSRVVPSGG